jgi:hypothetical protein
MSRALEIRVRQLEARVAALEVAMLGPKTPPALPRVDLSLAEAPVVLPVMVRRIFGKYGVVDAVGTHFGKPGSKADAEAQAARMNGVHAVVDGADV